MAIKVSDLNTIVTYLDVPTDITLSEGKKVRIERTKSESFFVDFRHDNSHSSKIVGLVAGSPLLTMLAFLHTRTTVIENEESVLAMPLVLDPRWRFTKNITRDDYKVQREKLSKIYDEESEASFLAVRSYQNNFMDKMAADPTLAKFFRHGRKPPTFVEIRDAIDDVTSKNPRLREMERKNRSDMSKHLNSIRLLGRILTYSNMASSAETNCQILSSMQLRLPSDKEQIDTALSKFASLLHMATESLCLDCWYEHDQHPFMASSINTRHVRLEQQCPNCGGIGLVHKVELTFTQPIAKLIVEGSNWFHEVLVGYIASRTPGTKTVFVHKNIQAYSNGNMSKGAEVDVVILTDDAKLYLVEVTKKSDANAILCDARRKIELFRRLNLPFERMAFVTASTIDHHMDMGPDLRIFSLKHLASLQTFLGRWIKGD